MQATVARKPHHRGEREVSRNPTAQGGRLTRLNLWRLARALKRCRVPGRLKRANGPGRFTAFGAAGAAGTRSPCALFIEEGGKREAKLGQIVSRERGPAPEQPERFLLARMPQAARAQARAIRLRECHKRQARCKRRKRSPRLGCLKFESGSTILFRHSGTSQSDGPGIHTPGGGYGFRTSRLAAARPE